MKSLSTSNFINILGVFNFCLLLAVSASLLFSSPQNSNANTVSAADSFASISNEDTVTIPITPTAAQAEYTATNKITFSNSCSAGAYVYINTSGSDNDLTRTGSDTGTKTISSLATGVSGLTDNTWGFKTSGNAFSEVPVASAPVVLYTSTGVETDTEIDVIYGVKIDHNLPSGTYTNDVVYTVAAKPECLAYTLKFDTGGGTTISDQSVNYGSTVDLSSFTTTRANYIFGGWSNGTSDFTGSETAANPNPDNRSTVTLSACWVQQNAYTYGYTGSAQELEHPCNGYYKVELWGASGGDYYQFVGGKGAYVEGNILFGKSDILYLQVGNYGTYNGGGFSGGTWGSNGGGATDLRFFKTTPTSSDLEWNSTIGLNSRIIVAAGGGSAGDRNDGRGCSGVGAGNGGNGGGLNGYNGVACWSSPWGQLPGYGGTQTAGGETQFQNMVGSTKEAQIAQHTLSINGYFGKGGFSSQSSGGQHSGGGSGYYGGAFGAHGSAGGGSSYISGHTGSVAIAEGSTSEPRAVRYSGCATGTSNNKCSMHYSDKYFVNTLMIDGAGYKWTNTKQGLQQMPNPSGGYYASGVGHSRNGAARVTYLGTAI